MLSRITIPLLASLTVIALAGAFMAEPSAQSGDPASQVATAGTKAVVKLEKPMGGTRSIGPTASDGGQTVLTLDLTLVKGDPNVPVALEITSICTDSSCTGAQPQQDVTLGQISLFPALRAGENRKVELQLNSEEAAKLTPQVSVELKPLVEGRGVGENAVKVNSAAIEQKNSQ
jgi:hypothetical protein